jgi:hypothetical protein
MADGLEADGRKCPTVTVRNLGHRSFAVEHILFGSSTTDFNAADAAEEVGVGTFSRLSELPLEIKGGTANRWAVVPEVDRANLQVAMAAQERGDLDIVVCLSNGKRVVRPVYGGSEPRSQRRQPQAAPYARGKSRSASRGRAGDEAR